MEALGINWGYLFLQLACPAMLLVIAGLLIYLAIRWHNQQNSQQS